MNPVDILFSRIQAARARITAGTASAEDRSIVAAWDGTAQRLSSAVDQHLLYGSVPSVAKNRENSTVNIPLSELPIPGVDAGDCFVADPPDTHNVSVEKFNAACRSDTYTQTNTVGGLSRRKW
jgi:hypothetical protein